MWHFSEFWVTFKSQYEFILPLLQPPCTGLFYDFCIPSFVMYYFLFHDLLWSNFLKFHELSFSLGSILNLESLQLCLRLISHIYLVSCLLYFLKHSWSLKYFLHCFIFHICYWFFSTRDTINVKIIQIKQMNQTIVRWY